MAAGAAPSESWELPTRHLGRTVWVFDRLDSTNTLALGLAGYPPNHGLAILAREQTAGRGQYGRTWQAPPRSSVLLSLLLFPPAALRRPALLTAWAAVSVADVVTESAGEPARLKWPNDVLLRDKKVCGILIEQRNSGHPEAPIATAVGIGLNVSQPADVFAAAGLPFAGSLASLTGRVPAADYVARRLIGRLDAGYDTLLRGDLVGLEADWTGRLGLVGRQVVVEATDGARAGRLLDVTLEAVVLESGGEVVRMVPEAVRHITEA